MEEKLNRKDAMTLIQADVVSRPNALNGKYKAGKFGLEFWDDGYSSEPPERVRMRADLADKIIAKAESEGQDTTDLNVIRILGEEVNSLMGKSIPRSEAIMTSIMVALQLTVYYGIAVAIWGLAMSQSLIWFGFFGGVLGILINLFFVVPIVAFQRTKERIRDIVFAVGATWGNIAILISILGLVVWVIRLIFFNK